MKGMTDTILYVSLPAERYTSHENIRPPEPPRTRHKDNTVALNHRKQPTGKKLKDHASSLIQYYTCAFTGTRTHAHAHLHEHAHPHIYTDTDTNQTERDPQLRSGTKGRNAGVVGLRCWQDTPTSSPLLRLPLSLLSPHMETIGWSLRSHQLRASYRATGPSIQCWETDSYFSIPKGFLFCSRAWRNLWTHISTTTQGPSPLPYHRQTPVPKTKWERLCNQRGLYIVRDQPLRSGHHRVTH